MIKLLEFKQGIIVGGKQMRHFISEIVGTPQSTVSHVYPEYLMKSITINYSVVADDRSLMIITRCLITIVLVTDKQH